MYNLYFPKSDALNIDIKNGIPKGSKIHPKFDNKMNVKKVTKRRVGDYGATPFIVIYFDLPYTLYHPFVLYSLATNPSERPSCPLAAGAAAFKGLALPADAKYTNRKYDIDMHLS